MYTIGTYTLDPGKPFKTMDAAVKFTQERYPELSREEIERFITPKIKEDGEDKSDKADGQHEAAGKSPSKTDKRGVGSEGTTKD